MTKQQVAIGQGTVKAVQTRLKEAMNDFVAAQRMERRPNDDTSLVVRAAALLGDGWSGSSVQTARELKGRAKRDQLPQANALRRFCDVAEISAEWLFANLGPKSRRTIIAGGTLSAAELAREVRAHMVAACAPLYPRSQALTCDQSELLRMLTDHVVALAMADAADADAWDIDQAEYKQLLRAAAASINVEFADGGPVTDELMSALYLTHRRLQQADAPSRRVPIAPEN